MDKSGEWYTQDETAKRVGVSPTSVRAWASRCQVTSRKIGGRTHYDVEAVDSARVEVLGRFEDILDLRPRGSDPPISIVGNQEQAREMLDLRASVRDLESRLRQIVAARASVNEAVEKLLSGEMQLLDALLGAAVSHDLDG